MSVAYGQPVWNYNTDDTLRGPTAWAKQYPRCNAPNQSPISITAAPNDYTLRPFHFDFFPTSNYSFHNVEGNYISMKSHDTTPLLFDHETDMTYYLHEVTFHSPSEHMIGNSYAAMEAQFHFRTTLPEDRITAYDRQLMLSALYMETSSMNVNAVKAYLWDNKRLPRPGDEPLMRRKLLDFARLVPISRSYYTYVGSLSRPPCYGYVKRVIMDGFVSVNSELIDELRAAVNAPALDASSLGVPAGNARPISKNLSADGVRRFHDFISDGILFEEPAINEVNDMAHEIALGALILAVSSFSVAFFAWRISHH